MENLKNLKEQLTGNLQEIFERSAEVREEMKQKDPGGNWSFEDLGSAGEFDDVLDRLGDRAREEAIETWQAIQRIDQGTYGTCSNCGGKIEEDRLKALPATEYCLACATRLEADDT